MRPVFMTSGEGNCFSACIASILEIELSEVPDFCPEDGSLVDDKTWLEAAHQWLQTRGLGLVCFLWEQTAPVIFPGTYCIVGGKAHGSDEQHAIVATASSHVRDSVEGPDGSRRWGTTYRLEYVHDPSPIQGWIEGEPREVMVITR